MKVPVSLSFRTYDVVDTICNSKSCFRRGSSSLQGWDNCFSPTYRCTTLFHTYSPCDSLTAIAVIASLDAVLPCFSWGRQGPCADCRRRPAEWPQ